MIPWVCSAEVVPEDARVHVYLLAQYYDLPANKNIMLFNNSNNNNRIGRDIICILLFVLKITRLFLDLTKYEILLITDFTHIMVRNVFYSIRRL